MENKLASLIVVSLGKTLNGMHASLCGRQVAGPRSLPVVEAQSRKTTHRARAHTQEASFIDYQFILSCPMCDTGKTYIGLSSRRLVTREKNI